MRRERDRAPRARLTSRGERICAAIVYAIGAALLLLLAVAAVSNPG
ncbi:hypothetical protein [Elioraea sp.]|nr:hypothetical protein [Elioraea sp.]